MNTRGQLRQFCFLFSAALIWGVAFVAQSVGIEKVGCFTFNGIRFLMGAVVLLPVIFIMDRKKKSCNMNNEIIGDAASADSKKLIIGGIVCGLILCTATNFQQIGIKYTTAGKAGFITAFYIVLVPVFGIFIKKKCPFTVWISVVIAIAGLGFLCLKDDLSFGLGELFVFVCAVIFALHILAVDHFVNSVDGVKLSCIQFVVAGVISCVVMILFENPQWEDIKAAWLPLAYTGILSSGVAYTFQIVGQKGTNPTVASLILSLESVVSVLAGLIILKQGLAPAEVLGCVLMFTAIILAQIPVKTK